MEITQIQNGLPPSHPSPPSGEQKGGSFLSFLQDALTETNRLQHEAEQATRDFVLGQAESVHATMLALEKADIALRFITQVRNKVVEAYQEIMRMQV
ncbi:MAG: flagellar hook-basal body complex protein FliE [Nitrospinota bacterium]|nr:MAG: flagellar hook-basal body complex protein FliE [Nitrospinota bacterium]